MKGEAGRRIPEALGTRGHTRFVRGLLAAKSQGLQGALAWWGGVEARGAQGLGPWAKRPPYRELAEGA